MIIKDKDGKLKVYSNTPSKSTFPQFNRKQRRAIAYPKRYLKLHKLVNQFARDLRKVGANVPAKVGGKRLTGYYSQLLTIAEEII